VKSTKSIFYVGVFYVGLVSFCLLGEASLSAATCTPSIDEKTISVGGRGDYVISSAISPSCKLVAIGYPHEMVAIWDLKTGTCVKNLYLDPNEGFMSLVKWAQPFSTTSLITSLAISPNDQLVVAGYSNNMSCCGILLRNMCKKI